MVMRAKSARSFF